MQFFVENQLFVATTIFPLKTKTGEAALSLLRPISYFRYLLPLSFGERSGVKLHPLRTPQLLPFRHREPSLLLQFEQGRIHPQFLRSAVGDDVLHLHPVGMRLDIVLYLLGIKFLVVHYSSN